MAMKQIGHWLVAPVLAGILLFNGRCYADSSLVNAGIREDSRPDILIKRESPIERDVKYPVFDVDKNDRVETVGAPFVHTEKKTNASKPLNNLAYPDHLVYLYLAGLVPKESLGELERAEKELLPRTTRGFYRDELSSALCSSLFDRMYETRYTDDKIGETPSSTDIGLLVEFLLTEGFIKEGFIGGRLGELYDIFHNLSKLRVDVRLDNLFNDLKPFDRKTNRSGSSFSNTPNWRVIDKFHFQAKLTEFYFSLFTAQQRAGPWEIEFGAYLETGLFDRF